MDDIYIIHEDKEYLKGLLNDIQGICDELGLFINPKKTQIVKLSHGFTFLKIKYNLTGTGTYQQGLCHKDAEKAEEVPEAHGCRGDVL